MKKTVAIGLAVLSLLLAQSPPLWAQHMTFRGIGMRSCADFTKDYQSDPKTWEPIYYTWAEGYMSGLNAVLVVLHGQDNKIVTDLGMWSVETQEEFLRTYCDHHPSYPYYLAANQLFEAIRDVQQLKPFGQELSR